MTTALIPDKKRPPGTRETDHMLAEGDVTSFDYAFQQKVYIPQVTLRGTLAGLLIGSVVLISNFQFGLQTGWVSMMSLPSALLGFAIFKYSSFGKDFTDVENVYVQSIAVAVGTGPLAYGLIGIVPAIEKFLTKDESGLHEKIKFSLSELIIWSFGLAFFGVFFAVPLREQVIVREKLPFPSGSATATLISVLYGTENRLEEGELEAENFVNRKIRSRDAEMSESTSPVRDQEEVENQKKFISNLKTMKITFMVSAAYTVISYFVPILKALPIFGSNLSNNYKWNFQPSPAYIGQGIIMGLPTVSYMLFGAILGWAVLAPLAKYKGWAPGDIDDWVDGGQGWILWLSLSVMISDSLVSFAVVSFKSFKSVITSLKQRHQIRIVTQSSNRIMNQDENLEEEQEVRNDQKQEFKDVPASQLVGLKTTVIGLILSSAICVFTIKGVFGSIVPVYATIIAIFLALLFSILGVRALGETDLNPVSGIGKLSQLIFAAVIPSNHPSKILINVIAGGIAEAGAQQAGDLMQDLKTGHLLGASPKALFTGQLIGTLYSVVLSSVMYKIYNMVYEIPSDSFRIPTAIIWIDCSRLVTGEGLPPKSFEFSVLFGIIFGSISLIKNVVPRSHIYYKYLVYLPNGVAVGIGIYNSPNFTLARFLGGLIAFWFLNYGIKSGKDNKIGMVIFSSGLVLGEGLLSGFTMLLTSLGVKHF
ncbi:uncharacterized protein PRCAT00003900001 [Priceomyces carsonii]|uniref:uncharacterized protein n=1 Tax=Priceomyces carsonii TaxID=28549 RepID=UPI002ED94760|nr:unnamed protein product [Priceomyces carsonii]